VNYRLPEPTRIAHHKVNEFRRGEFSAGSKEDF
jgi:hypothetical protein